MWPVFRYNHSEISQVAYLAGVVHPVGGIPCGGDGCTRVIMISVGTPHTSLYHSDDLKY